MSELRRPKRVWKGLRIYFRRYFKHQVIKHPQNVDSNYVSMPWTIIVLAQLSLLYFLWTSSGKHWRTLSWGKNNSRFICWSSFVLLTRITALSTWPGGGWILQSWGGPRNAHCTGEQEVAEVSSKNMKIQIWPGNNETVKKQKPLNIIHGFIQQEHAFFLHFWH